MPNNYILLEKIVVGSAGASSVTFANIPQTGYTDLVLKVSVRNNNSGMRVQFNSDSGTNYSWRRLNANGTAAFSDSNTTYGSPYNTFLYFSMQNFTSETANTFSNGEMYVPNYTGSTQKSASLDSVAENNATSANMAMQAGLWTGTAAITTITLSPDTGTSPSFAANSTFYLYGVAKLGTTPAIAPKATGGDIVMTDGTYWYHTFNSSGTFTPAVDLSCDYLVVAGGGGGASAGGASTRGAGGGGAGGYRTGTLTLSATAQTVTIGAGGAGGANSSWNNGVVGNNSVFGTITSAGGGYGSSQSGGVGGGNGGDGGSGGGQGNASGGTRGGLGNTPSTSPSQGNNGGADGGGVAGGGGGGGSSSVGSNSGNNDTGPGGAGGSGTSNSISGSSVTYAVGGTGGAATGGVVGANGTANRGNGGGGASGTSSSRVAGGSGGSGIVVVRYLVA